MTSRGMTGRQAIAARTSPALSLLLAEPARALLEYVSMRLTDHSALPRGDGSPVVIFPGLAANHHSTAPLKSFCDSLGYAAYDWGRGVNTGPRGDVDTWLGKLARHVESLTATHAQPLHLIGWSLGGIYARELAKLMPRRVRQVITVGTPFADIERTRVGTVYRLLNGEKPSLEEDVMARVRVAPDVPCTSIYSRTDGIVSWEACIQDGLPQTVQHIEVQSSHVGMGWNRQVLAIIADKLKAST